MAEWLYEAGIGEARAALVEQGAIVEAHIEPDDGAPRVGAVVEGRLVEREGRRGVVRLAADDREALVDPVDPQVTLGSLIRVAIVREAIPEPGARKRMTARLTTDPLQPGPTLHARIAASGHPVRTLAPHGPDLLEAAGWSELLEAAAAGALAFPGGALRISLTPAMTLIDVDGSLPPPALAVAGAQAAAAAIRRFDLSGSIGIDVPTVAGKAERTAIGAAFDALMPPPFERTAVNGFGFMQVVRPRLRPSLCERLRHDPAGAQARALLRRVERSGLVGAVTIAAHPDVVAVLEGQPGWIDTLARRLGGAVTLRREDALAMSAGDASPAI